MNEKPSSRRVRAADLKDFSRGIFQKANATQENAEIVSEHLVEASLRGVDSHGVSRIPVYLQGIIAGDIDPRTSPEITRETSTTALIDGRKSFGQVAALFGTKIAASKARKQGISAVGIRNLNHVGMLGYYCAWLADNGLIGKAYTNGLSRVAPWGGRRRIFGTNPICFGFPLKGQPPLIVDLSTAMSAAFKIILAARNNQSIPIGWAVGPDGSPTTDPSLALEGALLPMAGHKGYGLGVSVELFSSALIGAESSVRVKSVPYTQGGFYEEVTAIDSFRNTEDYYKDAQELVRQIKDCPLAKGFETIYLPGEPEARERARRLANGLPIADSIWKELEEVATKMSMPLPPLI